MTLIHDGLSIAEASAATGVSTHTLRYYERAGLLPAPARTSSGYRDYRPADVDRLRTLVHPATVAWPAPLRAAEAPQSAGR